MMSQKRLGILVLISGLIGLPAFAKFTYEGTLTQQGTTTPILDSAATFKLALLDSAQACILYEETQTVSTLLTNGYYSIVVGQGTPSGNDSGNGLETVFASGSINGKAVADGTPCSPTQTAQQTRFLKVTVTPSLTGVPENLTPNLAIHSASRALVAQTLDGLGRADLVKINQGAGYALSQSNLENVFSTTNYPILTALLSGTSSAYVKAEANNSIQIPVSGSTPPAPAAGQMWFESGVLKYWNGSMSQTLGVSGAGISSLTAGTGLTGGVITASGSIAVDVGTADGQIVQVQSGGKLPALDATDLTNVSATKIRGISVSATSPSGPGQLLRYDGTTYVPAFISMFDLRSTTTGSSAFGGVGCLASQTLTWNSGMDNLSCTNIALPTGQVTGLDSSVVMLNGQVGAVNAGTMDANPLTLKTNNMARLTVSQSGNIGIGTANPSSLLEVARDGGVATSVVTGYGSSIYGALNLRSAYGSMFSPSASQMASKLGLIGFSGYGMSGFSSAPRAFIAGLAVETWTDSAQGTAISMSTTPMGSTTSTERFRIESNGDIGIGVSSPMNDYSATTMHLHGSNNSALTHYTNATTGSSAVKGTYVGYFGSALGLANPNGGMMTRGTSDDLVLGTQNIVRVLVSSNGNVGIGTTAPSQALQVEGNIAIPLAGKIYSASAPVYWSKAATGVTAAGALALNTASGSNNTAVGVQSLYNVTAGTDNVAVGFQTGLAQMVGNYNVFLGSGAGNSSTGSFNIVIGAAVDVPNPAGSNQLNIGNTIFGDLGAKNVGIGTSTPTARLEVAGNTKLNGHVFMGGSTPTLGSCGGSGSVTGNDSRGTVMIGSTGGTSCQVNFGVAFGSAPVCVVSWSDASPPSYSISGSASTTVLTVNFSSTVASKSFNYICIE